MDENARCNGLRDSGWGGGVVLTGIGEGSCRDHDRGGYLCNICSSPTIEAELNSPAAPAYDLVHTRNVTSLARSASSNKRMGEYERGASASKRYFLVRGACACAAIGSTKCRAIPVASCGLQLSPNGISIGRTESPSAAQDRCYGASGV